MANKKTKTKKSAAKAKKESKATHKINKNMSFGEILGICPESGQIMASYGLHCIGCHFAFSETLEQGCRSHGLEDKQIDKMTDEINTLLKKGKPKKI